MRSLRYILQVFFMNSSNLYCTSAPLLLYVSKKKLLIRFIFWLQKTECELSHIDLLVRSSTRLTQMLQRDAFKRNTYK